jgi:RNA polymerase sigma-70 factor (ECF subfamily)
MSDPQLDTVNLHRLIERMREGDNLAADDLLRAAGNRLELLARRMLRSFPNVKVWADTGDVLQNALLRLLRTLHSIKPASTRDFLNLAAVQIRRELLDLARQFAGRRYGHATGGTDSDLLAAAAAPSDSPAELELWRRFHDAVENLDPEEREVVSLTFYHGWTQPQIAELLGVAERTVRRRWTSATARLAQLLDGQLPPVSD